MIPFNKPPYIGKEKKYIHKAIKSEKISGDGKYSKKCNNWFEKKLGCQKALLVTSCTHALEMAAILLDIKEGDEVIMPSYTFVSTANAFVLRGAKIVFVDIRPDTMNIDETKIEAAITKRTKIIVPVHYAGLACEMDTIMHLAKKHDLYVVEDAAQGLMSTYKDKMLGTFGHIATFSFHETKNYTSAGEGGLLVLNDKNLISRAEIIRQKGTNRNQFERGEVNKYSWVDIGSSYLLNDISAAYLWAQLKNVNIINDNRIKSWNIYFTKLKELEKKGLIELARIPKESMHNGHMFYIKCKDYNERKDIINYLFENDIKAVFHYVPLHTSKAGKERSIFNGIDNYTSLESERILRLPLYYNISTNKINKVCNKIKEYYQDRVDD